MTLLVFLILSVAAIGMAFAEGLFKYDAKGKRDPFVPLVSGGYGGPGGYASDAYAVNSTEDVRLEGIVWDEVKGSVAIINGEIVKEGQELGSIKVLKIHKDNVIFDVGGSEVKVELSTE
ncbi:MAG: hypothetical protein WC569_06225 [Candidatus Omnitrophota bacterium]